MTGTAFKLQQQIDGSKLAEKNKKLARKVVKLMAAHRNCGKTAQIKYRPVYDADGNFVYNSPIETEAYNRCLDECGEAIADVNRRIEDINDQLQAAGWEYRDRQWQPPRSQ